MGEFVFLNKRATELFSILENIGKTSKYNYNILKEIDNFSKINENIDIKVMNIEENIETKNQFELSLYCNKKLLSISENKNFHIYRLHEEINSFYSNFNDSRYFRFESNKNLFENIENMGFIPTGCPKSSWPIIDVNRNQDHFNYNNDSDYGGRSSFDSIERNNMGWD